MLSLRELGVVIGTVAFVVTVPLPTAASASGPDGLTLRYAGQGWTEFSQAGGQFTRGGSSQAILTIPAGATIEWAGLYWGSGPGTRAECAENEATAVHLSVGDASATVLADSLASAMGMAYQAYADVTALVDATLRGPRAATVTGVAATPGCTGGWTILVAHSTPGSPQATASRTVTVYDGLLGGEAAHVQLGQPSFAAGSVNAAVLGSAALWTGGTPVPFTEYGSGYHLGAGPLAGGSLQYSSTGYAGLVLGVTTNVTAIPTANLALDLSASPAEVPVGDTSTLKLAVVNQGETPITGVMIVAKIPVTLALLTVVDGYEAGTGIWTLPTIAPHASAELTLPVRMTSAGVHVWDARVAMTEAADLRTSLVVTGLTVAPALPSVPEVKLRPAAAVRAEVAPGGSPGYAEAAVPWPSVPAGAFFAVALGALSLMVPLALRLSELRRAHVRAPAHRRARPRMKGPPVHPPELTYPCCLPALGRFVR